MDTSRIIASIVFRDEIDSFNHFLAAHVIKNSILRNGVVEYPLWYRYRWTSLGTLCTFESTTSLK